MNEQINTASLADLKSYLRWHILHRSAPNLSKAFDTENFAFFSATLQGQKEQDTTLEALHCDDRRRNSARQ